jgi:hypothetical protein
MRGRREGYDHILITGQVCRDNEDRMKRFMLTMLLFLGFTLSAHSQGQQGTFTNPQGGNLIASSTDCSIVFSCVWMKLPFNANTSAITLSGTFSATVLVEESGNNGLSFITAATLSSTGLTTYPTNGLTDIRVRISAFTSGQVGVTISTGVNTGPQGPPGTNGGPVTVGQLPLTGTWAFGGTLSGNFAATGTDTFSSINNIIFVDGVTYPFTQAGVQAAFNQACANNLNQGGTVHIVGRGVVIPLASATGQLLLSSCPLRIEGDGGEATFFSVASGISSAIPVFRLKVTSNTLFYEINNIEVGCTSGCPTAGDAFLLDSGGGTNPGPSAVRFEHVRVTSGSLNGFDINETGSGTNFQFAHHLQDSYFEGGGVNVSTVAVDEQFFEHNLFNMGNASNPCISMTQAAGASHTVILGNWMACGGGYLVIHQATQPQLMFNQMDSASGQVGCTETNSSMIDVIGDVGAVYGAQIHNNNLNAHTFCHNNIQFGANSTNWLAMANVFSLNTTNSVGACGINIVAGGTGGIIGPNIWFPGGTGYAYVCGDTAAAKVRLFANSATGEPDTRGIAPSDTDNAIVARGNSGTQSADLVRIESSTGTELSSLDSLGRLRAPFGGQASCAATGIGFLGAPTSGLNWNSSVSLIQGCIAGTSAFVLTNNRIEVGSAEGYAFASTTDPISAGNDTGISRLSAGIVQADTSTVGNGLGSYQASGYLPHSAGGTDLGTTALPFGNLWLGTAATNNFKFAPAATAAQRVVTLNDPGAAVSLPFLSATDTTTTHFAAATATGGVLTTRAIAATDLPAKLNGSCAPVASATAVTSSNPTINTDQNLIQLSIPAGCFNTLSQPFEINSGGIYSSTAASSPVLTFKIKLCTISGCGSGTVVPLGTWITPALNTTAITNATYNIATTAVTSAIGTTGTLALKGNLTLDTGALVSTPDVVIADSNIAVSGTIDLTAALFIDFTIAQSVAGASNSYTQMLGAVR